MRGISGKLSRFLRDDRGGMLVQIALAVPILIGFSGLSVDIATWFAERRVVQTASDAGAIAGALEFVRSKGDDYVTAAVTKDAGLNGLRAGDTLIVNNPPTSGSQMGVSNAVEVIIQRPARSFLSGLFLADAGTIAGRAVAIADFDDTCVWSLDPGVSGAINVTGGGDVAMSCGIYVNSNDSQALVEGGGACLTATKIKVVGGYTGDCINPTPWTGGRAKADPLSALPPPSYGGCDFNAKIKVNAGQTETLDPGVYCKGIEVSASATLIFNPGLYVLDGANLTFNGQSTVTGHGVTFYLTPNGGPSDNLNIQAGAIVDLRAPDTGPYAGILFYQDRNAPRTNTHTVAGGATMHLEGIVYLPGQDLSFAGGTATEKSPAFLIADTISFSGAAHLGEFEGSSIEANPSLVTVSLVE